MAGWVLDRVRQRRFDPHYFAELRTPAGRSAEDLRRVPAIVWWSLMALARLNGGLSQQGSFVLPVQRLEMLGADRTDAVTDPPGVDCGERRFGLPGRHISAGHGRQ
jgi:hypothetical protein